MNVGIDAGSKFIKVATLDYNGNPISNIYCEHCGDPEKMVSDILSSEIPADIKRIMFTGLHAESLASSFDKSLVADEISSIIEAVKFFNKKYRYIINVGAGSIKYIELDDNGDFYSYRENSLCAAGTGSFLDEQMHRMNFSYEELSSLPFIEDSPDIATRCAVFAKSDLIHRQQEGYTREDMWSGLCRGVVTTMLHSVFKGDIPDDGMLFCGGLFLNPIVRQWIEKIIKTASFHEYGHFFPAIGLVVDANVISKKVLIIDNKSKPELNILESKLSSPTDFTALREYLSNGNEVRIHKDIANGEKISMGIDVGSTSTKLVVINAQTSDVLIDIYRKTDGNPVEATDKLFRELNNIISDREVEIVSTGTTGSGRKLIGKIIGADLIVNEITAHFKGATYFDKSIETIFEIGGQDSKYIRGRDGTVVDCNMNFVCAAGTGSFIEEQSTRLGFDVREIGGFVLGQITPHTSDRCTVFMEQDINKLIREGYSREEVLAGVIRSIAKNYLNRVVGPRPITGRKIFFQGATARNRGLVAAFESILQREIMVSPYCHVMGSFGAALLSIDRAVIGAPRFRGLDVFDHEIKLEYTKCGKCSNQCKITIAKFDGGREESWGFMCGKESFDDDQINKTTDHFQRITSLLYETKENIRKNKREISIGIPLVLPMLNQLPLWKGFFEGLGFKVVVSGKSTQVIKEMGVRISKSDFCFPFKIALAHIQNLSHQEDIDAIFFPSILSEKEQKNGMPRMLCPYVITYPSVAKNALNITNDIISPTIDFRFKEDIIIKELYRELNRYNISEAEIKRAYKLALEEQKEFLRKRLEYGKGLLKELKESNKTGIVCIGRPYNLYDKVINLGLTERLKEHGIEVFPYECMIDPDYESPNIHHMYWNYGERILSVSEKIRNIDNIYPVYFTNFSCGPDSFILTKFEDIMQGKPYLIIELDEHGSETGYLTRIEAFFDVVMEKKRRRDSASSGAKKFRSLWRKKNMKLWFPSMYEITPRLFAAAFRAWGFDAEALPIEDNDAFEIGRQNSRGSECLPASTTIGIFLKKMKEIDADPERHALFMPTAEGPCRFGQYSLLHRHILDKNGFGKAEIFSPTSRNSYLGMTSSLRKYLIDAMMSGDTLSKFVYGNRPYEINKGEIDTAAEKVILNLEKQIEDRCDLIDATGVALDELVDVPLRLNQKPLVGIVGEIYVRSNPFCNNNVIRYIENSGGEAWLSPLSEWIHYTSWMERYYAKLYRNTPLQKLLVNYKTSYMFNKIHSFEHAMEKYLPNRNEPDIERVLENGKAYVPLEFEGEVILTIGRAVVFLEDGAAMVVNCAPFGCMPGNITTSIFQNIQRDFDKPIINLFYDGESDINRVIGVYLNNINKEVPDEIREVV